MWFMTDLQYLSFSMADVKRQNLLETSFVYMFRLSVLPRWYDKATFSAREDAQVLDIIQISVTVNSLPLVSTAYHTPFSL